MITNKDISIDSENGKITLNGNKYDLGTQGEIDTAVKDVYSVMGQNGAKNLIPYPFPSDSYSQRGIEFTALSDGTINANGTNDGTGNSTFNFVSFTLSKGSYALNGCPAQTGVNYRWGVVRISDSTTLAADYGSGANFTIDADTEVSVFVQVVSGKTVNNLIFKPMLRLASDTDNTYEPYAMTNKQLTEQVETLDTAIDNKISVVQPANEEVTVAGPYTDITFTPPVEAGYTFYLISAVAINLANWNMSNINPVAGSIRIFTSDTTSVTNQVKTTWLKIKNS